MDKRDSPNNYRDSSQKVNFQVGYFKSFSTGIRWNEFSFAKKSLEKRQLTIKGEVVIIGDFPRRLINSNKGDRHSGVIIRTKHGRHLVHLGPARYFWKQDFPIKVGDRLEISGLRTTLTGRDITIIAEKVSKQGKTLKIPKKF